MSTTRVVYVDETGDTGNQALQGSSNCFGLGCVILDMTIWPNALDQLIAFRRNLRQTYGIPSRAELKANYLIRGNGPLKTLNLSTNDRRTILRAHLQMLSKINAKAFAVVIDKTHSTRCPQEILDLAWETLLQRLERSFRNQGIPDSLLIMHDQGPNIAVRTIVRRARRHLRAGSAHRSGHYNVPVRTVIDDPVPKDSQQSYMLQLADLVAYTGWRSYMPPSANVAAVAPQNTWSQIGTATLVQVNGLKPHPLAPKGVVIRS